MTITERMIPVACQLAGHVRAADKRAIFNTIRALNPEEAYALVVVLAAMVPTDRTAGQLLDWTELRPCGTHAAYWRHKARSEALDAECVEAERAYQRDAKRQQRRRVRDNQTKGAA